MKRGWFLRIALGPLLLAIVQLGRGQGQPSDKDQLQPFIQIASSCSYRNAFYKSEWMEGRPITVTTTSAAVRANSINVSVMFDKPLPADAGKHLRLTGQDQPFVVANDPFGMGGSLRLKTPESIEPKHYTLIMDAGLKDTAGHSLGRERRIEINTRPPTFARFDLLGGDETYQNIGIYGSDPDIAVMHLNNNPKDFRITFTSPVDRPSVEGAISESLKEKPFVYSMKWINDQALLLHIDRQALKDTSHNWPDRHTLISFKTAHDREGSPILGEFSYDVDYPCRISLADVEGRWIVPLKEFQDRIFMTYRTPIEGRFITLDDGRHKATFDVETRKTIAQIPLEGIYERNICWVDRTRFLSVNGSSLTLWDMPSGRKKIIYSGLDEHAGCDAMSLSPDRKLVALMQEPTLRVISLDGRVLYQSRDKIRLFQHDILAAEVNLVWLDDKTIIYDACANPKDDESLNMNIFKVDLATSQTTVLIRGAMRPAASPSGRTLIYERPTSEFLKMTYHADMNGQERELNACHGRECEHFMFLDEHRVVFERLSAIKIEKNDGSEEASEDENAHKMVNEIVMLDLNDGRERVITTGSIIGLSPDRQQIYTNSFKGELHYMD